MNVPMKVRQEQLGHIESSTTMGYTHRVTEDDRLVSKRRGEILMPNDARIVSQEVLSGWKWSLFSVSDLRHR